MVGPAEWCAQPNGINARWPARAPGEQAENSLEKESTMALGAQRRTQNVRKQLLALSDEFERLEAENHRFRIQAADRIGARRQNDKITLTPSLLPTSPPPETSLEPMDAYARKTNTTSPSGGGARALSAREREMLFQRGDGVESTSPGLSPRNEKHVVDKIVSNGTRTTREADLQRKTANIGFQDFPKYPTRQIIDNDGNATQSELRLQWEPLLGSRLTDFIVRYKAFEVPTNHGPLKLREIVDSTSFLIICLIVVFVDAILLWSQTDFRAEHWTSNKVNVTFYFSLVFMVWFWIELLLRLIVHRHYFFFNESGHWNTLDFVLVAVAFVELAASAGDNMLFRPLIALRLLRFVDFLERARAISWLWEFRLMVATTVQVAGPAIVGGLFFMYFFLLLFSIFFVNEIAYHLKSASGQKDMVDDLTNSFGSVSKGIVTLFKSTVGGRGHEVHQMLEKIGQFVADMFVFYIFLMIAILFNILTAIFVQGAKKAAQPTLEEEGFYKVERDIKDGVELARLCQDLNRGRSVDMNVGKFRSNMESSEEFAKWFRLRGLEIRNPTSFFQLMHKADASDSVTIPSFVSACLQLRGDATRIDLHMLAHELHIMALRQAKFEEHYCDSMQQLLVVCQKGAKFADVLQSDRAEETDQTAYVTLPIPHLS